MKMSSLSFSSAETVANIEELLKQILVSVPALSLIRFKSVSKHWLSLISDPEFCRRHTLQNPNPKISAFFSSKTEEDVFKSIPLESPSGNPFKTLNNSVTDGCTLKIIQSCKGLFLCNIGIFGKQRRHHPDHPVYVVNPTTNQFRALSSPRVRVREGMDPFKFVGYALAFDPSRSPHYKVVCVTNTVHSLGYLVEGEGQHHKIDIYSSETGNWKHLNIPFFQSPSDRNRHHDCKEMAMHFDSRSREGAVYCNGALHWIRDRREASLPFAFGGRDCEFVRKKADVLHYFDIGEEQLRLSAVTPPVPLVVKNIALEDSHFGFKNPTEFPCLAHRYFGECGDPLYLTETYEHCNTHFEVMEMERDYSGWFVKYIVDLSLVFAALPRQDWNWNACVVLCLSREEETDDLLLHMPGKVISYNPGNKSFNTSVELANKELFLALDDRHPFTESVNFPYMETLAFV